MWRPRRSSSSRRRAPGRRCSSSAARTKDLGGRTAPMRDRVKRLRRWCTQHPKAITLTGSVVVGGAVAVGVAGKQGDFASAVGGAPIWILSVAVGLHLIWLVARSEAWHVCVGAAGGTV